jgi:hypothetical protein
MQRILVAAAALSLAPSAAAAHPDHAAHGAHPAPATAPVAQGKLTLDTPVETIVADAKGRAALEAAIPGITAHPHYEHFKAMSLRQLQPMAPAQITPEVLAKAEAGLAAIN